MGTLPPQSYLGWKVSVTVLQALAICSAIYRLAHRIRIRRAWWDDYIVFIPLVLEAVYCPLFWVQFRRRGDTTSLASRVSRSYWLSTIPFMTILWSTRIALSLSLARLFPKKHAARLWSFVLVVVMIVSGISCLLVSALTCHRSLGANGFPVRTLYIFAEDFTSDALLILSPTILFRRLKLPRRERIIILLVFSGSALTLMYAVVFAILNNNHMVSLGTDSTIIIAGLQNIEVAISLFVCNLAVVSTCFYQAILRYYKLERPELVSSEDTARGHSQQCTCFSPTPTALTLTEISISNFFDSERSQSS
ncbi:hypothetical protein CPB84DRAFT_1777023 [Gymnopilus junonius]|uniref:Rhodopsin domain-containing protein n=1 Tax=Gymnopilus junonius TaxID=109634 RepID=A0A9P5NM54_GYMJU|nr:hypothetical protein CPB84DRAFT_1777023 [Gymnopilus junonius]